MRQATSAIAPEPPFFLTWSAVAIDANGNLAVAGGETFAVDAGVVLVELIGAQTGIVGAHQIGIGMA